MIGIEEAYSKFRAGSRGFCRYIATHSGMELSRAEIERIASVAPNASAFLRVWQDADFWQDAEQE